MSILRFVSCGPAKQTERDLVQYAPQCGSSCPAADLTGQLMLTLASRSQIPAISPLRHRHSSSIGHRHVTASPGFVLLMVSRSLTRCMFRNSPECFGMRQHDAACVVQVMDLPVF